MSRIQNKSARQHCRYCCPHPGWVVVDVGQAGTTMEEHETLRQAQLARVRANRPPIPIYSEQLAPCPKCELGFDVEYPTERDSFRPVYDSLGYWQGRDHSWLTTSCSCDAAQFAADPGVLLRELAARYKQGRSRFDEGLNERKLAHLAKTKMIEADTDRA